jgi:hypothetical protein
VSRFLPGRNALRALRGRVIRRRAPPPPPPPAEPRSLFGPPSAYNSDLFGEPRRPEEPVPRAERPRFRRRRRTTDLPGRLGYAIGASAGAWRRTSDLRGRVGYAIGATAGAWRRLDIYTRRRLAVLVVALVVVGALIATFLLAVVPALPCQFPGGSACPLPDDAAKLVPGDALVYVHADLDRSTSQYRLAAAVAARVPTLSAQLISPFARAIPATGGIPGFVRAVQPWVGDEAALALLPARGPPQQVNLLAVADERGARRYRARVAGRVARTLPYRGVNIERSRRGVATAIVSGFLVIGTKTGVRKVIDAATGARGALSLAATPAASRVRGELPANRVADAYLSPAGVAALAGRATGLLSSLAPFVAPGATEGAAAALVAGSDRLELEIRSALDPQRATARPGFFAAFSPFDETLASRLPARTLAYVGFGQPGRALLTLLREAGTEEPGLARSLSRLLRRARKAGHVAVRRDLLPAVGDEAALALEPGAANAPALPSAAAPPYVVYAGGGVDSRRARAALARLRRPIAHALAAGRGHHRPKVVAGKIAGTATASLRISRLLHLTYAIEQGLLVLATNPAGVATLLRERSGGLAASDGFGRATAGLGGSPSLLAYLNVRGLIALGERAGLAANRGYALLAPELRRLQALGISVRSAPDELDTSARLLVGG